MADENEKTGESDLTSLDRERVERLRDVARKLLDDLCAISAPKTNECDLQVALVSSVIKVAVAYAYAAQMPTSILATVVSMALNDVSAMVYDINVRRSSTSSSTPAPSVSRLTDAQAREILARLKDGGRVH